MRLLAGQAEIALLLRKIWPDLLANVPIFGQSPLPLLLFHSNKQPSAFDKRANSIDGSGRRTEMFSFCH
jgi:hypothetical protein